MKINVLPLQSFLDLAIQHTGDVGNAFLLAKENGKSLTDDLVSSEKLTANYQRININKDILDYYTSKGLQPATAIPYRAMENTPQGIDYWAIGVDFIIS